MFGNPMLTRCCLTVLYPMCLSTIVILCVSSVHGLHTWNYDLKVRDIQPKKNEGYAYFRFPFYPVNKTSYIIQIIPERDVNFTHHMILHGCTKEASLVSHAEHPPEDDCSLLLYAWAHRAPALRFPPGIGIMVGESAAVKSFQLEIHYLVDGHAYGQPGLRLILTDEPQPKVANVFLMFREDGILPEGKKEANLDISCRVPHGKSFTIMAMRTHAHHLGRAISGYRQPRNADVAPQFLGSGNPQWPQSFYSLRSLGAGFDSIDVQGGDILLARCSYDTRNETKTTRIGSTHNDEMCNLYIMYYGDPVDATSLESGFCSGNQFPFVWKRVSVGTNTIPPNLPPNILSNSVDGILGSSVTNPVPLVNPPERLPMHDLKMGSVTSLATVPSSDGCELIILHQPTKHFNEHRSERRRQSFLTIDPVMHINPKTMRVCQSWGAGLFVRPYSITVTFKRSKVKMNSASQGEPDAIFVVDMALHQVLKFIWGHFEKPAMVLGERFDPGPALTQFCQPTDVAITSAGEIIVADGYCNARIVKFSANGSYLSHWSASGILLEGSTVQYGDSLPYDIYRNQPDANFRTSTDEFRIVHSLAVIPSDNGSLEQVCAADRENAAVICYTVRGERISRYTGAGLRPSVYSIAYSARHGRLFGTTGSSDFRGKTRKPHGFILNLVKPSMSDELSNNFDNAPIVTEESAAVTGFFTTLDEVPHDFTFSFDEQYLYFAASERNDVYRSKLEPFQDSTLGTETNRPRANRVEQFWILYAAGGPRMAGIIMLFVLALFILTFFGVRMCCHRRKLSRSYQQPMRSYKIPNTEGSRVLTLSGWGSRESRARRAGFMPLSQDGDTLELEDQEDETDLNDNGDVLFDAKSSNFTTLPVSAESGTIPALRNPRHDATRFVHSTVQECSPRKESVKNKIMDCVA